MLATASSITDPLIQLLNISSLWRPLPNLAMAFKQYTLVWKSSDLAHPRWILLIRLLPDWSNQGRDKISWVSWTCSLYLVKFINWTKFSKIILFESGFEIDRFSNKAVLVDFRATESKISNGMLFESNQRFKSIIASIWQRDLSYRWHFRLMAKWSVRFDHRRLASWMDLWCLLKLFLTSSKTKQVKTLMKYCNKIKSEMKWKCLLIEFWSFS